MSRRTFRPTNVTLPNILTGKGKLRVCLTFLKAQCRFHNHSYNLTLYPEIVQGNQNACNPNHFTPNDLRTHKNTPSSKDNWIMPKCSLHLQRTKPLVSSQFNTTTRPILKTFAKNNTQDLNFLAQNVPLFHIE